MSDITEHPMKGCLLLRVEKPCSKVKCILADRDSIEVMRPDITKQRRVYISSGTRGFHLINTHECVFGSFLCAKVSCKSRGLLIWNGWFGDPQSTKDIIVHTAGLIDSSKRSVHYIGPIWEQKNINRKLHNLSQTSKAEDVWNIRPEYRWERKISRNIARGLSRQQNIP